MICTTIWGAVGAAFLLAGDPSPNASPAAAAVTHVVLIGGFDSDPTPAQLNGTAKRGVGNSGMYQLRGDLLRRNLSADYFNWNGTAAGHINDDNPPGAAVIVQHIRRHVREHPSCRLGLVGNSMGGHTAWEVCEQLDRGEPRVSVKLLVLLDPSSSVRVQEVKRPEKLPANVEAGVQYASRNIVIWRPLPDEKRILNIDLADPQHGFLRPGGPNYAAVFDPNAHIGAEWDDRIHADICRRLWGEAMPSQGDCTITDLPNRTSSR